MKKQIKKPTKVKKESWDVWDIEKITKDFKITIRIEKRI